MDTARCGKRLFLFTDDFASATHACAAVPPVVRRSQTYGVKVADRVCFPSPLARSVIVPSGAPRYKAWCPTFPFVGFIMPQRPCSSSAMTNMKRRRKRRAGAYRVPSTACEFRVVPVAVVTRVVKSLPRTRMPRHTVRNRFHKPNDATNVTAYRPFVPDLTVPYSLRMTWTGESHEDDGTASWPSDDDDRDAPARSRTVW